MKWVESGFLSPQIVISELVGGYTTSATQPWPNITYCIVFGLSGTSVPNKDIKWSVSTHRIISRDRVLETGDVKPKHDEKDG